MSFWVLVPVAIAYTVSLAIVPVWQARNLVIVLPAVYILLARVITFGITLRPAGNAIATAFICATAYTLVFSVQHHSEPQRPRFREVASYIAGSEDRYPEAPVLSCTYVGSFPLNY